MALRRLSEAVRPVNPANADPNRYVYLTPENVEPSLGVPTGNGFILFSNIDGSRAFTSIGNLLIAGNGILISSNGRIALDPNAISNVTVTTNLDITRTGFTRFDFVTPTAQTFFEGPDVNGQYLAFSENDQLLVYIDGYLILPGEDYTYSNNTSNANLTLSIPTFANSLLSIVRISPTLFGQGPNGNAGFSGTLFASNVIEDGNTTVGNVFFTNTRAINALTGGDGIVIEANGLLVANVTTSDVVEGSNLYFTNARAVAALQDNINTSNVAEGANLYFTNARAVAALQDNINTSNVTEGANLYFTNTRAVGALTAGQNIVIESNGLVIGTITQFTGNTDGIAEGVTNLYYTNARVESFISDSITTSNIAEGSNLYFTNTRAVAAVKDNIDTSNVSEGSNLYYTNARVQAFIGTITTSNIVEGANLYFTNTRAIGALTAGQNIVIEPNGLVISSATFGGALPTIYTSNIVEDGNTTIGNVYFTNQRARQALSNGFGLAYETLTGVIYFNEGEVKTSNVPESGNLYFTNTRAVGALTAGENIVIEANGMIISAASISSLPTLYASNIVQDGNPTTGNVFFTNARARSAFTFGSGLDFNPITGSLSANVGTFSGNTNAITEGSLNLYYTNARAYANIAPVLAALSTSNIREGSNLYFTNTRAVGALTGGTGIIIQANGLIVNSGQTSNQQIIASIQNSDTLVVGNLIPSGIENKDLGNATHAWRDLWLSGNTIRLGSLVIQDQGGAFSVASSNANATVPTFTTDQIAEGANGNIYFTNARVYANVAPLLANTLQLATLTTANVVEVGTSNLYFNNSRAVRAFTAGSGLVINANGLISTTLANAGLLVGLVNASNVIETGNTTSGNVFFSNARARSAFSFGIGIDYTSSNGLIRGSVFSVAGKTGNVTIFAGNVVESGNTTTGNVFFTNARAVAALTAGNGIVVEANGMISATAQVPAGTLSNSSLSAGVGISLTQGVGSNLVITNTGVFRVNPAVISTNGLIISGVTPNVEIRVNPNQTLDLAAITTANVTTLNLSGSLNGFINASRVIETGNTTTGNVFFSNTRAIAALRGGQNIVIQPNGLIIGSVSTFTGNTDVVVEGATNLYFTNARADARITPVLASYATKTHVSNELANLVNSAPATLDTLNELAAALGDDADFANTITTSIGTKASNTFVQAQLNLKANLAALSSYVTTASFTTANIVESSSDLFYTNARVQAYLNAEGYTSGQIGYVTNTIVHANLVLSNIQVRSLGIGTAASGLAGEIRATNDITAFYSSDRRLKTNVIVIDNALTKLDEINGVTFDWNETALEMYPDRTGNDVGVIAQEIAKVLPQIVTIRDNNYMAVRYEKIIPLLIQAIKELKDEVDELKKKVQEQ